MADREKSKILLIDDDTSLLVTLSDFLSFEGYDVTTADSGEKGLQRLTEMIPDLIILDMSMPGMGGVGFLNEITTASGKPKHPVLVLTARANMAGFFSNVEVDGFVAKPCNPEDLLMEVGRIIFLRGGTTGDLDSAQGEVPPSVLIGEDDAGVLELITKGFTDAGYVVGCAAKGPEVIEKAIIEKPDFIVIKRVLTGMNGDAVSSLLKDIPNTHDIPVVLYDDKNSEDPESRYTQSGVDAFVRSHEAAELVEAVRVLSSGR